MFSYSVPTERDAYELSELSKMFGMPAEFTISGKDDGLDKNTRKRALYKELSQATGKKLDWGILIGVRPLKLYSELTAKFGSTVSAEERLQTDYFLSPEKIELLHNTYLTQQELELDRSSKAVGIYIGIPFCPTRCLYCSFTSNKYSKTESIEYIKALLKEIDAVKKIMERRGLYAESIYIGGGTPSSLEDEEFEILLSAAADAFCNPKLREWTVECGRPDTITESKLLLVKKYGAGRISINPQTMNSHTLELIGRSHTPQQIYDAFAFARKTGIECINTDLITGLPEEVTVNFTDSLKQIIDLGAENITVHTLAVKRASRLIDEDPKLGIRQAETVREMLDCGSEMLKKAGYRPYYLYRQKQMSGNFENVGYCKGNTANIYNIRIMAEDQSIIALGAGGISKIYYPEENRLERVPNVSNYRIYIERIDEMIQRKENGILC